MGSLGKRMRQQVQERFDFLSDSGPLSIRKQPLLSMSDDDDTLDKLESKDAFPHSPQLACDFYLKFGIFNRDGSQVSGSEEYSQLWDSDNWVLSESTISPAKLSWSYHSQIIGYPVPNVSGDSVRLTFFVPSNWEGINRASAFSVKDYFTGLMKLYENQFTRDTGLLRKPTGGRVNLVVGLEVEDVGLRWDSEYRRVPLFSLTGVKFGTPSFVFDRNSVNPMGVSVDLAYSGTKWSRLDQVQKQIENLSLPDVTVRDDQLKNR